MQKRTAKIGLICFEYILEKMVQTLILFSEINRNVSIPLIQLKNIFEVNIVMFAPKEMHLLDNCDVSQF